MSSTIPLNMGRTSGGEIACGGNSELGEFGFVPMTGLWYHRRVFPGGYEFQVTGRGRQPTAAQIELWRELDQRLAELVGVAAAAVVEPDASLRQQFDRSKLFLSEVRFEEDGSAEFFLGPSLCATKCSAEEMPVVVFRNCSVVGSFWST